MNISTTDPLKVQSLEKNYGRFEAVKGVSFEIRPGEIFGLLGPNGAGKTSIISIITTLERLSGGDVKVFGESVNKNDKMAKSLVGCVPQEIVSHGFFNVDEILEFVSGYYGIVNNKKRIDSLIERLGLGDHRHKKISHLSGGMKRRFMIAKALVHSPKLLLLDEPTAGVDIELRNSLWEFVRQLNKEEDVSILLTTHYLEEAEELCDRVGIIDHGLLKKIGPTRSLIKELTTRQVRLVLKELVPPPKTGLNVVLKDNSMTCHIPYKMGIGELMEQLNVERSNLMDIEIHEGDLEDVFVSVVGGANA